MTPRDFIQGLCLKLINEGIMVASAIRGYSEEELAAIGLSMGMRLPEYYKEFLRVLGKDGGGFMMGSNMFPKNVESFVKWRQLAIRLMIRSKAVESLPENALVFGDHEGYQFWFFLTDPPNDNPAIYYYHENATRTKKAHDSFTEFLDKCVEGDRLDKAWVQKTREQRNAARAAFEARQKSSEK